MAEAELSAMKAQLDRVEHLVKTNRRILIESLEKAEQGRHYHSEQVRADRVERRGRERSLMLLIALAVAIFSVAAWHAMAAAQ